MKKNILPLLLVICASNLWAQNPDTLVLRVNTLKKTGIILRQIIKGENKAALREENDAMSVSGPWVFKIENPKDQTFQVVMKADTKTETIADQKKTYLVDGVKFEGRDFKIGDNLMITVTGADLNKIYTLKYRKGAAVVTTGKLAPPEGEHQVGSTIKDAYYLVNGSNMATKISILAFYAGVEPSPEAINAAYINNKRIKPIAESLDVTIAEASLTSLSALFSSVGGLDVTQFADGLTKFLVKRTKEELNIAFFSNFYNVLEKPEFKDLRTVFPQTYRALKIIGNEIYNYERYIQTLREAFKNDLNALITNLPTIIDNHPEVFNKRNPEMVAVAAILRSGLYTAEALRNDIHPGYMLEDFPILYLDSLKPAFKASIQTLQLFSMSLRDTSSSSEGKYWISMKDFKKLTLDTEVFPIYLGLVEKMAEVRYNGIPFSNTVNVVQAIEATDDNNIRAWQEYVNNLINKGERVAKLLGEHQKPGSDSLAFEQYYNYFKASIDLLEHANQAGSLPGLKGPFLDLSDFFDVANTAADLTLDIHRKNYAAAITNVTHLYDVTLVKHVASTKPTMDKMFRYGSFMASMAMAKSSDEVADAIEAAALPTGSARIKRETKFNVSLNAYVGPFIGNEKIRGVDFHYQSTYGLSVPVGVAVSTGIGKGWSTSLFFSVIDLGALASFRFSESQYGLGPDSTATVHEVPSIQLEDIIAPGVFLSVGIPKSPLSVNLGVQSGPSLRKITVDDASGQPVASFEDNRYVRWCVSLVVDIPLINFYTKPRD